MDVLTAGERLDQTGVGGEVSDAAQLDLVVVGDEQRAAGAGHEALPELAPFLGPHRDVVQVGLVAAEPAGAGHRLVERGVDATVRGDLGEQRFAVRAAQLLDLAVLQQRLDELRPLVAQLLERGSVGGEARLGLLRRGEAALGVQDLAQLNRRVDVERAADDLLQHTAEPVDLGRQTIAELLQRATIDGDADVFHLRQHPHQRVLDRRVQVGHALQFDRRLDRVGELRCRQRIASGPLAVVDAGLAEVELALGLRLVGRKLVRRVLLEQVADRVARLGRVDEVGGDRCVE